MAEHVGSAAALERTDVTQLAEEQVPHDVAPEPDRHRVLGQQPLVADQNVVLREFGAKRRSDRRPLVQHDLSQLGEPTLVAQIKTVSPLISNNVDNRLHFSSL